MSGSRPAGRGKASPSHRQGHRGCRRGRMGNVMQAAQEPAELGETRVGSGASAPPLVAVVEDSVILAETLCAALEAEGIPATAVPVTGPGDLLPRITALPARLVL